MKRKTKIENIQFDDFKESFIFDSAPLFVGAGVYAFANTLEEFKHHFKNMSDHFMRNADFKVFEAMFNQAAKYYKYPKAEAKVVLAECENQMLEVRSHSFRP